MRCANFCNKKGCALGIDKSKGTRPGFGAKMRAFWILDFACASDFLLARSHIHSLTSGFLKFLKFL